MPKARRQRVVPTEDWQRLQLLAQFAEQRPYEMMRAVVIFGQSPAKRTPETSIPQAGLYCQVDWFYRKACRAYSPLPRSRSTRVYLTRSALYVGLFCGS